MWKTVLGVLLVLGSLSNLSKLSSWEGPEKIGFNLAILVMFVGGGFLTYKGLKK